MKKVATIIVPVDFSDITPRLVDYAVFIAGEFGASIHFVHVISMYYGDAMFGTPFAAEWRLNCENDCRERMKNLVNDTKNSNPGCSGEVHSGDPVEEIVRLAEEKAADMVVMSTHGAKGLEKILLGSVTERVVKRVCCPVLVMNPHRNCPS